MHGDPSVAGYTVADIEAFRAAGRTVVAIDVRSAEEFAKGSALGARHVPPDQLETIATGPTGTVVVTVCNHGGPRSQGAAARLRSLGVESARHLVGGVHGAAASTP
jgi:rhodanese-related sulfurtransferase